MPKLRIPTHVMEDRAIVATIKYGMEITGIDCTELAVTMHTCLKTVYDRFKHPENFRLHELRAISQKLHIPLEKLIKGETE